MQSRAVRLGLAFALALAHGAGGCVSDNDAKPKPKPAMGTAPGLSVEPAPGAVFAYTLDVTITAANPATELLHAIDEDPNPTSDHWVRGELRLHLIKSSSIRVLTRDAEGRVWGPFAFEYVLRSYSGEGACIVRTPARLFYRADEAIPLKVDYLIPAALSKVELVADGQAGAALANPENALGVASILLPALKTEGTHQVSCRVRSPAGKTFDGNSLDLFVDATKPALAWSNAGPGGPPTHYRLTASDGYAGLARAEFCDDQLVYCLPMQAVAGGYLLATAFAPGAGAPFSARARVFDAAGNAATLAAPAVAAADFPAGAAAYVNSITLSTAASFDLAGAVAAEGAGAVTEVRSLDFTPLPVTAQSLSDGWNEFLFRRAGDPSWQTYGLYRSGVRVALPAAPQWLVYAGQSTVPAQQAVRLGAPVTGATWSQPWLNVPNLFLVADLDANGAWDDSDSLYLPGAAAGPWLAQGALVTPVLATAVTRASSNPLTAGIACDSCANGPALVLQRRDAPAGPPVGRSRWPGLDFSSGLLSAHAFTAEDAEYCQFFWDEDGNGVASGAEPRGGGACAGGAFTLRRHEPAALAVSGTTFTVAGVPYGGAVTGVIEIGDAAAGLVTRVPIARVTDFDGTGLRTVPLPHEGSWPGTLTIWTAAGVVQSSVPGQRLAAAATASVDVQTSGGARISAAVEAFTPTGTDYVLYGGGVTRAPFAFDPAYRPRLRALRDGYLSEWTYLDAITGTLALRATDTTGVVHGDVVDTLGRPVTGAVLEWSADPYFARAFADGSGVFTLPALGHGRVTASQSGSTVKATLTAALAVGEQLSMHVILPAGDAPGWPAGLVGTLAPAFATASVQAPIFTGAGTVWGTLAPGAWELGGENFARGFTIPGALPAIALDDPAWVTPGLPDVLTGVRNELRCGARRQTISGTLPALIDSPCWAWYAQVGEPAGSELFLGNADTLGLPVAGVAPVRASFAWYGLAAAFQIVVFRDKIFNRTFSCMTDAQGVVSLVLPRGFYLAETGGGTVFSGEAPVSEGILPDFQFSYP